MSRHLNIRKLFPLIFFLSLITFGFMAFKNPGVDFRGYYGAAVLVLRGGNPYDYAQLAPVLEEISGFQGNNPYFYPPWYCLAFIPLTFLPFRWAQILWILINLALFYISLEWLWEILEWKIEAWFRWVVFTFASILFGFSCLISENSGFVLFFALVLTLRSFKQEKAALAGLGLVLMSTKPQAMFIIIIALSIWAWKQNPKILLWALGWATNFAILATLIIPKWWDFDRSNFGLGIRYYQDGTESIIGQRVAATIYDWLLYFWNIDGWLVGILVIAAAAFGLYLVVYTWRNYPDPLYIAAAATLFTLLVTPYALQYDFVPLTLTFFLIAKCLPSLKSRTSLAIAGLLLGAMIIQFFAQLQFQAFWIMICMTVAFWLAIRGCQNMDQLSLQSPKELGTAP